ncbi:diazepam binding inhibitor, acyl-CoA binding protein [Aureococcus anophagefferens]|uniref:Diazepam binding inhibitor, acyl-CoA binding protein n=1 Tax=Aureococcus anophagefferens TaxID=44056 RepID=A0ABR1FP12_AURAN
MRLLLFALGTTTALRASWSPITSKIQPSPRSGAAATATTDGSVYLFGGYEEDEAGARTVVDDLWRYDADGWTRVATGGPGPRLCSALAAVGGELFLFGGWDPETEGTGGSILDDVWAYDIAAGRWESCAPVPGGPASRHVCCALAGGDVLVHTHRSETSVLLFDAATREWREQATSGPAPSSRGLHVAAAVDAGVVVFGGADKSGAMCADAFVLGVATWTWRALGATGPAGRAGAAAAPLDATSPRNALVLCPSGGGFLVHGGWRPFVETYGDTLALDVSSS